FDVEHRVDEMFGAQRPDPVLPPKARKKSAVVERVLTVQVELGRPPRANAVFDLQPERMKIVAALLRSERREVFNFEIVRLLQVVVISPNVRAPLRKGRRRQGAQADRRLPARML